MLLVWFVCKWGYVLEGCVQLIEEEGERTSWNGCEKLVWLRVGSLGVVGFVPDHWFA